MTRCIVQRLAILLILALVVCAVGCEKEPDGPNVRYFSGGFVSLEGDEPQRFVIESRTQLENWLGADSGYLAEVKLRHPEYVHHLNLEGKPAMEYCEGYTDSFFEKKYLLVVQVSGGCVELWESQGLIYTPSGQLRIFLNAILDKDYQFGPDAAGAWCVVYEFDRADGIVTEEQVSVVVDGSINELEDIIDPRLPVGS